MINHTKVYNSRSIYTRRMGHSNETNSIGIMQTESMGHPTYQTARQISKTSI